VSRACEAVLGSCLAERPTEKRFFSVGIFGRDRVGADFPELLVAYPRGAFVVPAADLCFSAATFLFCACVFMIVMFSRRRRLGYELGGDERQETGAFLCFMWLFFVVLSVTQFHGGFDHVDAAKAAMQRRSQNFFGLRDDSDGSAGDGSSGNNEDNLIGESESMSWEGQADEEVEDPVHQLLLSVVWVFLALAGMGALLVVILKAQRAERYLRTILSAGFQSSVRCECDFTLVDRIFD
jgi:hypothetical protein